MIYLSLSTIPFLPIALQAKPIPACHFFPNLQHEIASPLRVRLSDACRIVFVLVFSRTFVRDEEVFEG